MEHLAADLMIQILHYNTLNNDEYFILLQNAAKNALKGEDELREGANKTFIIL